VILISIVEWEMLMGRKLRRIVYAYEENSNYNIGGKVIYSRKECSGGKVFVVAGFFSSCNRNLEYVRNVKLRKWLPGKKIRQWLNLIVIDCVGGRRCAFMETRPSPNVIGY
jgi:hypothetical protein